MSEHTGPVYEVTLSVDADVAQGLDDWLAGHVALMLDLPGVSRAETGRLDDTTGRESRVVRYYLESDEDLDSYLAGPAAALQQQLADRFDDRFVATR
ncbi:MAG: DUF4286 family protein, partial [Halioglobus sp.]|nr:DUF4286 family protein [Halioglobus sp.]